MTIESEAEAFEQFGRALDYSMFLVTTRSDHGPAGCLVGFASEVSIHPPRFLAGLSIRNHTYRVAENANHLAVHIVSCHRFELVELFGGRTGDLIDKFSLCAWHEGPHGMPILDHSAGWFVGEIRQRVDLGDHIGHLLAPVAVQPPRYPDRFISLADVRDFTPGHEA